MTLAELAAGPPLDVAIIGGGINGCAIAEEASARGLRVALFEADDFGFGTSWRSTRLIHGGLRYLEHGDVRLVFESLRERSWLLRKRDYLVRPQRFILPVLPWTRRPAWQLGIGLSAYDLLALYRGVPSHRRISDERLHEMAPFLPAETRGGFTFFDARILAPERLCLELALQAERNGATIANHAPVTRIDVQAGAVAGVVVEHGSSHHTVPARRVVNAAGPWVDAVAALIGDAPDQMLGVTRGTHIVVELDEPPGHDAVFSTARADGRVFFSVPQGGNLLLIGTTDERFDEAPSSVRPTAVEGDYLLQEAEALLPGLAITRDRVRYAFAGLRPLQRVAGGPEAAISRRHAVIDHAKVGGPAGLLSVVGGKLSTFRPLAREVVESLGPAAQRSKGADPPPFDWRNALQASGLAIDVQRHLRMYGPAIPSVLESGMDVTSESAHAITGEVVHACRHEHVQTLSDVMLRRTSISWGPERGLDCHGEVARIAAGILGWDEPEVRRQVAAFEADVAYHLPTEDALVAAATQP